MEDLDKPIRLPVEFFYNCNSNWAIPEIIYRQERAEEARIREEITDYESRIIDIDVELDIGEPIRITRNE